MTCIATHRTLVRPLFFIFSTLLLASCSSTSNKPAEQQLNTPLGQATKRLTELFSELSDVTKNLQTIKPIDQCRFEISTHWNSESQGHYRATHIQRFSLKHDLRAVDHSPTYIATFDGQEQQWQEKLQLTFNRLLPYQFNYYDSKTFEYHQNKGSDDQFSLVGFSQAPLTLMKAIESTLIDIAQLCGNDLNQIELIDNKIIGHWNLANDNASIGELTIATQQAQLIQGEQTIRGPYTVERKGDYYRLIISPIDQTPTYIALDFIHSNYARLLLLKDEKQSIEFRPLNQSLEKLTTEQDKQLHLFRLGDLL